MQSIAIPAATPPRVVAASRIASIDLLRGLIMIIMALDHVRDYFHADAFINDPTDLTKTTPILFFTRWITHFCAPLFMFLSGISAYISGGRKSKKELSVFLLTRGLWLIVLELTVVHWAWYFNFLGRGVDLTVIWALGLSMILLAALIHLPRWGIATISLAMIFGHNLLDGIHVPGNTLQGFGWALLHEQRPFFVDGFMVLVGYPIVPWVGVMGLGYCLGQVFARDFPAEQRRRLLTLLGFATIALFIIIRAINVYGDGQPWSRQPTFMYTVLSFLNTVKYPPSLLYLLMTIGPALLFLAWTEREPGWLGRQVSVIGRVPMFYYLLHLYLIHLLAMFATSFSGHRWGDMLLDYSLWTGRSSAQLEGYGFSLGITYLVWVLVVVLLFPLCKWYDQYKRTHKDQWWLSYL
ncbi:heparan-alpha-glucosaminide N-acetyltransferase domain-containing protein [Paraflavitalea sp. CAU 1676]|uniref:DUF1624 domain-containing protein n=1 Tax=Paraflavitalea sp. CAU 1676 TaxID=3032598 RepID=UPI0023DBA640|nr:heparan-alpha-glucosaminide N-acetyltransferase domain-containing protein [Paraflavitalea sp. CAU 1676]MDF2187794.1 heparan-alpha-glucosaminide N-acetyltransferase domain-containing protein [Paraflavitalea sp. CAU 1676]